MQLERRKLARDYWDESLGRWLESMTQTHQLAGLVLAEEDGFLVASTLPQSQAETIAVQAVTQGRSGVRSSAKAMDVHRMMLGRHPLFLCVLGDSLSRQSQLVVEEGIRRILA